MQENQAEWLPHLSGDIVYDVRDNYLDAYVVALEGWRRGLTLRWHVKESEKFPEMRTWFVDEPGQLFSLSSKDKAHYFFRTRGDKVTNEAVDIGRDKERTKQLLQAKNVRMPEGKQFEESISNETIIQYANELGYPVVLKPTDGSFGRGVISNIPNQTELVNALEYLRTRLNDPNVIVESYIPGKEYRIYVVDAEVVGAMNRIPANVTGDGVHSIRLLIDLKNEERSLNPRLVSCPIIINEEVEHHLQDQGFTLDSVLEKGKRIFLTYKTNISIGGDPLDVLDMIPTYVKEAAIQAIHAVPGLHHGAVDLIVHEKTSEVYVIELNPTANLGGLLYPIEGKARDIPKAIIDYYFPETKKEDREVPNIYFDYKEVLEPLKDRSAYSTMVVPLEAEQQYGKKYIIEGEVQNFTFHQIIKGIAIECSLNGYIKEIDNKMIEVVIVGTSEAMLIEFTKSFNKEKAPYQIDIVTEESYSGPVKIGFEIERERKHLLNELKKLQINLIQSNKSVKKLEKQHRDMLNSRAWKMTLPIRKFTGVLKKIYRSADK